MPCVFLRGSPNSVSLLGWWWGTSHSVGNPAKCFRVEQSPCESLCLVLISPTPWLRMEPCWLLECERIHCQFSQGRMTCSHSLLHHCSGEAFSSVGNSTNETSRAMTVSFIYTVLHCGHWPHVATQPWKYGQHPEGLDFTFNLFI